MCSYRFQILDILRGRDLLHSFKKGKHIDINIPVVSCSTSCLELYTDGCVQLETGGVYLVGADLKVSYGMKASLVPSLPKGFIVEGTSKESDPIMASCAAS